MTVRYATAEDVRRYPFKEGPQTQSMRAVVIEEDGELKAIGGAYSVGHALYIFSEIEPGYCNGRAIVKAAKMLMGLVKGMPLVAVQNTDLESSGRFLAHLGFKHEEGSLWRGQA